MGVLAVTVVAVASSVSAWSLLVNHGASHIAAVGKPAPSDPAATTITLTTGGRPASAGSSGSNIATQVLGLTIAAPATANSNASGNNGNGNGSTQTNSRDRTFILRGPQLAPGGHVSGTVTISIQGQPSNVSLSEAHVVQTACGRNCPSGVGTGQLGSKLVLTITDTTTNPATIIYLGPLTPSTGPLSPNTPLAVCGVGSGGGKKSGTCPSWANREAHVFTFNAAFPSTGNVNDYQGTSATLEFDWTTV
jgi:hypothetical protein